MTGLWVSFGVVTITPSISGSASSSSRICAALGPELLLEGGALGLLAAREAAGQFDHRSPLGATGEDPGPTAQADGSEPDRITHRPAVGHGASISGTATSSSSRLASRSGWGKKQARVIRPGIGGHRGVRHAAGDPHPRPAENVEPPVEPHRPRTLGHEHDLLAVGVAVGVAPGSGIDVDPACARRPSAAARQTGRRSSFPAAAPTRSCPRLRPSSVCRP